MDDEDFIHAGNPLLQHLRNVGLMDMYAEAEASMPPRETLCLDRKKTKGGTIDCDVIEEVLALRAANLLFEEDIDHVDCIFANFDLAKNDTYRFMFKGKASALVLTIGLFLYIYIGSYAFFFVSIYYAYRTSEYLWKKHTKLKRLKRLMKVMQSNFSFFVRLLKFVFENENMLRTRFGADSSHRAFIVLAKVKTDFIDMQQEVNDVLAGATLTLLEQVPLCDHVENPSCYICQNSEYYKTTKLSQLHNVYMLLQSQFLTRLIFSLVPNLLAKHDERFDSITDIVCKVSVRFHEIQRDMNKKFKFVLTNGIYIDESMPARRLPSRVRRTSITVDSFVSNIHELSNSLQFSLIKSRELESSIHCNTSTNIESELNTIRKELSSCLLHIEDVLLLNKKNKTPTNGKTRTISEDRVAGQDINFTEIGYSNLDPELSDDIFEGSTTTNSIQDDSPSSVYDYEEEVDILAKQQQKHVLVELKTRLKQQAEEWARREALVRARKGMAPPEEPKGFVKRDDSNYDEKRAFKMKFQKSVKKPRYRHRSDEKELSSLTEETNSSRRKYDAEKVRFPTKGASLLAASIKLNREKMASSLAEESYCGSGENSEDETET